MLLIVKMTKSVPAIADGYNKHMGGIGKGDQILFVYLDERKPLQWTKKVIFNLLMQLVMNSHILYKLQGLHGTCLSKHKCK